MSKHVSRRGFLKGIVAAAAAPYFVPAKVLGADGAVAPSDQITLGGIGIGNRGGYDLSCFLNEPDVRFLAICDVREQRRQAVKKMAGQRAAPHRS